MDEMLFPEEVLAILREARYDPEARRGFEALRASFHWSDECLPRVSRLCMNRESQACFNVMVYRSSLIRGKAIEEFRRTWEQLREACPEWPGFRPERCSTDLASDLDRAIKKMCLEI